MPPLQKIIDIQKVGRLEKLTVSVDIINCGKTSKVGGAQAFHALNDVGIITTHGNAGYR